MPGVHFPDGRDIATTSWPYREGAARVLVGPILSRELLTTPRRPRHYLLRATYAALFFVLLWTAWQAVIGFQPIQRLGDLAQFHALLFPLFAYTQLAIVLFAASLYGTTSISHEKDRRTFVLLLVTRLSDSEIVVNKFLAGLMQVVLGWGACLPVFAIALLLGGVAPSQLVEMGAVTLGAASFAASVGVFMALWRDKTFQAIAMTLLTLALLLLAVEATDRFFGSGRLGAEQVHDWAERLSPVRAMSRATFPEGMAASSGLAPSWAFLIIALATAGALLGVGTACLRFWNPRGEPIVPSDVAAGPAARAASRAVWDNPVLWREVRTRAYGARPIVIKIGYLAIALILIASLAQATPTPGESRLPVPLIQAVLPLCILSLLLVNAQAVTAITSERDVNALDVLLASDLTPREFIFGKLAGAFWNAKEMLLAPFVLLGLATAWGWLEETALVLSAVALAIFFLFAGVLGLHSGLRYASTRVALAHSLGTVFLLFVGILLCLFLIVLSGQFETQWLSFVLFIAIGSIGLWVSLSANAPSGAITLAAAVAPVATFYCVVAILVGDRTGPFLVASSVYGFAIAALLVPMLAEFDVATGRTTHGEG